MKLSPKQRQQLISKLTTNCACWKDGKETLEALPDEQLKAIADGAEATAIATNAVEGFTDPESGGQYRFNPESSEWEKNLVENATPVDDEEEDDDDDELTSMKKSSKKQVKGMFRKSKRYAKNQAPTEDDDIIDNSFEIPNLPKKPKWKGLDDWYNDPHSAPPEVKEIVANGKKVINQQKRRLVEQLVGNIEDDARREALAKKYMAKQVSDLAELVEIKLAGNEDSQEQVSYQDPFAMPGQWRNPYALTENEQAEVLDLDGERQKYAANEVKAQADRGELLRNGGRAALAS